MEQKWKQHGLVTFSVAEVREAFPTHSPKGDYIAGDKHVGAHIDKVESGGIGTQTTKE